MTQLETLLKQVSRIVIRDKTQQEEKRKRGEDFNIFSVLGLSTSEVRLHSAFLAVLLNPNGNHGLRDKFLRCFLETIVKRVEPHFELESGTAIANSEYCIGQITEDYTEGGRIDILIKDKNNHAIVIENKIYAGEQEKQLIRYQNYAIKNSINFVLLYLTLDRKQASEFSTDNQVSYKCISYKDDIIPWLQKCIGIAALYPQVREIVAQYKLNLEKLLGIMNKTNETQELLRIMSSHSREVEKIVMAQNDYRKYIFEKFALPKLKEFAQNNNLICETSNLFAPRGERGIFFYRKQWKSMAICLWSDHSGEWEFYFGISNYTNCDMSQFPKIQLGSFDKSPLDNWPNGYKYLEKYSNWDFADGTLTAMIEGDFVKYISEQVNIILDEIDHKNIKMI